MFVIHKIDCVMLIVYLNCISIPNFTCLDWMYTAIDARSRVLGEGEGGFGFASGYTECIR